MSASWSVAAIPDLSGRTAIVTGANSGIGFWTASGLAGRGAKVVMACRSMPAAERAAADLRSRHLGARIEVMALDVSDLESVKAFADAFLAAHSRLDLLINNAGVAWSPLRRSAQGFENQWATNYLGPFALTGRLLGCLRATPGSRVVNIGSLDHHSGTLDFADLNWERRRYHGRFAYAQSKLGVMSFTLELDRRLKRAASEGTTIAVGAHPGLAVTNIAYSSQMSLTKNVLGRALLAISPWVTQGAEQGAQSTLYAATLPGLKGSEYIGPQRLFGTRGRPGPARLAAKAQDELDARRLWEVSEHMSRVTYAL